MAADGIGSRSVAGPSRGGGAWGSGGLGVDSDCARAEPPINATPSPSNTRLVTTLLRWGTRMVAPGMNGELLLVLQGPNNRDEQSRLPRWLGRLPSRNRAVRRGSRNAGRVDVVMEPSYVEDALIRPSLERRRVVDPDRATRVRAAIGARINGRGRVDRRGRATPPCGSRFRLLRSPGRSGLA
jgi:hypothetical protein